MGMFVGLSGLAWTPHASAGTYVTAKDITYNTQGQKLDVYRPSTGSSYPIVIFVHGGGWIEGSKDSMYGHATYFAANNVVALSIDYRLAPQHPFPAAFDDVRSAVSWARANASGLKGDPNKIVLAGYSAGANLALLAGLHDTVKVRGLVGTAGPYDLVTLPSTNPFMQPNINQYMAGIYPGYSSPVNLASAGDPTVLLQHGTTDTTISPSQSTAMAQALAAKQVPYTYKTYAGAGHDVLYPTSASYGTALNDILAFTKNITR
ncbi:MAG: alpha/beta hydrolase [Candidatus Saccharimonadales bacterium]